ncbi:permease prefix domain 1-containing protein [Rathayibacter sp. YIM 133350]|uniref:permease prefix domain 1-containing protein n=1 Tax=Rathayibacter sp. YIM 133350 TaxID=3131992 RepID=UPI00307DF92E
MADPTAPRPAGGDIHRLLDEAFLGVGMTPDAQDLKEEVRANLLSRVADLEAAGATPSDAARQAIAELGDVRELVAESLAVGPNASGGPMPAQNAAFRLGRVRPKPGFVVGIVVASLVAAAGLLLAALGATGVLNLPIGAIIALLGLGCVGIGWIVGDALTQETTTNHPMPVRRAVGYGVASFLTLHGLGFGGLVALATLPLWGLLFAGLGVVPGIVLFSFLGATQTNRHKAWVRAAQQEWNVGNRFEEEPETAARFGIYTVVIWIVAFAVFIVLGFTIGWLWSWLALLGGFAAMMLLLARMLFGPKKH